MNVVAEEPVNRSKVPLSEDARTKPQGHRPMRCLRDIESGDWTREMEANFQHHARFFGKKLTPIKWPEERKTA